jgi:hypothetical protein
MRKAIMYPPALDRVLDGIDVETFLLCQTEEEGRQIAAQLMNELGFKNSDVIFIQLYGGGARVRIRAVINRPCDDYSWMT